METLLALAFLILAFWGNSHIIKHLLISCEQVFFRHFPCIFQFGGIFMLFSPLIYLVMNSLFFSLRLSGGGGSFPRPLKAEEERKYLEEYANGSLEARNKLVEHNLRLVAHIIKKYYAQAGEQDDLISIGTIGLIKGISTFKADKNVRLATYASRCIENEIHT